MKTITMTLKKIIHSIPFPVQIILVACVVVAGAFLFSLTAKADEYESWCDQLGTCWVCSIQDCNGGGGGYVNTFVTDIAANPSSITSGANSTISWNTSATNSNVGDISAETTCSITPTIGSVPSHGSGSRVVSLTTTTTYTLTCNWHHEFFYYVFDEGQSNSVTVTVTSVPTATLAASPTTIVSGNSSTLTWSSTGATSCTGTNFSTGNATSGSVAVAPSSTTSYSVSCTGAGGTGNASAVVTVTAVPTATLTASPASITNGSSSTLTWSSTNATSCTGTNFSTGNATSGSLSVSPTSNTTYSVSCTGAGGTVNKSTTVSVTAAQCADGIDNDSNGVTDLADPGCTGPTDNTESGGTFQCSDHIDNDSNGFIDYPADSGCSSAVDNTELGGSCSGTKTGTITASPTRVNGTNQTTTLTWSAQHISTSCVISGPGVNQTYSAASCAVTPTPLTTPVITTQSIYRLTCDGTLLGTAIVNVVPKIEEF